MKRLLMVLALIAGLGIASVPANAQVKKAEKALKNEKYDEALGYVAEALQDDPNDAEAFEVQGRIYQGKASAAAGDERVALLGQMMESFTQARAADPKMAEDIEKNLTLAYLSEFQRGIDAFNQAQSANDNNGYFQSARYFEGCTVIAPDSTGPYVNWAFALIGAGQDAEAITPLERAVEQGEPDEEVYTYLSRMYLTNDRAADAVPLLEAATTHFPDNEELQNNLLNAYAMSGQIDRAVQTYRSVVEQHPGNKVYRYNFGSLLLQAEQHAAAVEHLQAAVDLDAAYGDAQYNLGAAYVNWAIAVNRQLNDIDDDLRANRDALSADEIQVKEDEINKLTDERRDLFGQAVAPLENAKTLFETANKDVTDICKVLFQSYVQTGATDKAETVQACAGF